MKHCKNNDNKRENKTCSHYFRIIYQTMGPLSSALFFEYACALLPAVAVLILEPLIAVIDSVEGPQAL